MRGVLRAHAILFDAVRRIERRLLCVAEQAGHDIDGARRVEHVDDGLTEFRRDLHRGMLPAGCGER